MRRRLTVLGLGLSTLIISLSLHFTVFEPSNQSPQVQNFTRSQVVSRSGLPIE
jgi:hypothetical protein